VNAVVLNHPALRAWFAQNPAFKGPPSGPLGPAGGPRPPEAKLLPIPLGFENRMWPAGAAIEATIAAAANIPPLSEVAPPKLMYANFRTHTFPQVRAPLFNRVVSGDLNWATGPAELSPEQNMQATADHKYVLAPRGNGIDSHRCWETLLMGRIPVLERSSLDPILDGIVPVLLLDSYATLSRPLLEEKYAALAAQDDPVSTGRCLMDYHWCERIAAAAGRMDEFCVKVEEPGTPTRWLLRPEVIMGGEVPVPG
jgi:hypothetical protein